MTLEKRPPKRKPRGRHPLNALTPVFVRNVTKAGRYCDGQGLHLDVRPTGSRGWIQRLTIRGRRTELGLGGYPLVSLKEAREKAFANRKLAREGGDPRAGKWEPESMPTFADATRTVWKQLRPGWRSARHARLWLASLEHHAFPRIGEMPVAEVTSADVIGILSPIWHEKAATARKLRQRIRAVLEWAVAMDLRPDNPCDRIGPVLGCAGESRASHAGVASRRGCICTPDGAGIEQAAGGEAGLRVSGADGDALRRGPQEAAWTEIDRNQGVWTIPARTHEGVSGTPGPANPPCVGDPQGGAGGRWRWQPARFSQSGRGKPLGRTRPCRSSSGG